MSGSGVMYPVVSETESTLLTRVKQMTADACGIPAISVLKSSSGHLTAGDLHVRVSATTEFGETLPSERISLAVAENDKVTITIGRVAQAKRYNVYASIGAVVETFQAEVEINQNIATTYILDAIATGSALPAVDTATVHIETSAYEAAISAALKEYSNNFPCDANYTLIGITGTSEYALPASWEDGFSYVKDVQFPDDSFPPEYVEKTDYFIKDNKICFEEDCPSTGINSKMYYVIPHTESTIPDQHFEAVVLMAASEACKLIAVKYSHTSNKNIGADSVDYKMRSDDFRKNAEAYKKEAWAKLGMPGGIKAACGNVSWGWHRGH